MYDTYRIETLILAAPDIDLGVMEQRLVAEMFGVGFGQINVYMNPNDNALGLAGMVFGNRRFGCRRHDGHVVLCRPPKSQIPKRIGLASAQQGKVHRQCLF